jgi:hypothetical protein
VSGSAIVVVSPEDLAALVQDAVARALAEAREDAAPALLDRSDIARRLGVSPSTVDRLRREGMPATFVCSSPRFELDRCLDWLRAHSQPSER